MPVQQKPFVSFHLWIIEPFPNLHFAAPGLLTGIHLQKVADSAFLIDSAKWKYTTQPGTHCVDPASSLFIQEHTLLFFSVHPQVRKNHAVHYLQLYRIGKQLLMTRGSLTTFSVANDVAKYFAIIPALFSPIYPGLGALNILGLAGPLSAVLSAIIYNALVIVALIPAALKGVKYREVPSGQLLTHNLLVWGLGGIVAPFVFIKLIDMLLSFCGIM